MPLKSDLKSEADDLMITIDAKRPSEDAVLEHWSLIADAIKKIDKEKQTSDYLGSK